MDMIELWTIVWYGNYILCRSNIIVMYTVFKAGGKQYRAVKGQIEHIELCAFESGQPIVLPAMTFSKSGAKKATVHLDVVEQFKEDKVLIFKKKRRHNYRRTKGHRQNKLKVMVADIQADGPAKKAEETK
jgi:large subunit ribosomal protein L21